MQSHYDTWLSHAEVHEYTKGGNLKPPSRSLICDWVKSSWQALSPEMIKESFVFCAMTTSVTGSDNYKILCFKEGQFCAEGKENLDEEMEKLAENSESDDEDPFASDDDEEETESNEVVIDSTEDCDDFSDTIDGGDEQLSDSTSNDDDAEP